MATKSLVGVGLGACGLLRRYVRATAEFQRADASGTLIRSFADDGMALVFFQDPAAPVRCAGEIARALSRSPELKLRMGVHSGPVYRIEDITQNRNVSGPGINHAQRVAECGDAGHILLSGAARELLGQVGDWASLLHDLGEYEVKHGERLRLFSLHDAQIGNREIPDRLRSASKRPAPPGTGIEIRSTGGPARVALLGQRGAQPDEQVMRSLETLLAGRGHPVFVDRQPGVGVAWAKELERQLRATDVAIPFLSAISVRSEMLAHEVQIAREAADRQQGRPRLLPVRVGYTGPLREPLASLLEPAEPMLWEGPDDDERIATELIQTLRDPTAPGPLLPLAKLEPVGGAVPLNSAFYVIRPADGEFRAAVAQRDSIILLKGARQMGKTSLPARGLQQAREAGATVVLTDLEKLNADQLQSVERLFLTLAQWIALRLDLPVLPQEVWDPDCSPNLNFETYVRRQVLGRIETPLVWGVDEADRLFPYDGKSDVFGLFRSWYNERSFDPGGPWSKLTLAIAYATEVHLFITDLNQSPFNVGTRLTLEDFTLDQVADLNHRYGYPLHNEKEISRFYQLVSGQPYLVRRGLHEMATRGTDVAALEAEGESDAGIFGDHLRRLLAALARDGELCDIVRDVLRGGPCPTLESFYRLRSAGVLVGETAREARPRCQLYATYLARHLR